VEFLSFRFTVNRFVMQLGKGLACVVNHVRKILVGLFLIAIVLSGCGRGESVIYDIRGGSVAAAVSSSPEGGEVSGTPERSDREVSGLSKEADNSGSSEEQTPDEIYVYVCGVVRSPGVYELPAGSRVFQAVAAAGGLTGEADARSLNHARTLSDGEQVTVYTREEAEAKGLDGSRNSAGSAAAGDGASPSDPGGTAKVNINTAGREELMTLPGVGEAKADAIIRYRTDHGRFSSIEDIQNISGIKEKAIQKLKDYIEV
jgi:competence protein ComEA